MSKSSASNARKGWPFFALFVLVGLGLMIPFLLQAVRDYRIAFVYQRAEAEIMARRSVTSESHSKLGGSWVTSSHSHTEFSWAYLVNKRHYVAEGYDNHDGVMADPQEAGNLAQGTKTECWYDPAAPEKSVLVRHFQPKFYLGALIPGSFITLGGLMLYGVLRRKPAKVSVRITQGSVLRYRLAPELSTRGLVGCLGLMVAVLAVVIVFGLPKLSVGDATPSLIGGKGWLILICVGIEGFLIYHLVRAMRAARAPDPEVELKDEPLSAGQSTQLYCRLPGPAYILACEILLLCERQTQGAPQAVHRKVLDQRRDWRIAEAEECRLEITIPDNAVSSARSVQRVVKWCIRVRRELPGSGWQELDFPFRVEGRRKTEAEEE